MDMWLEWYRCVALLRPTCSYYALKATAFLRFAQSIEESKVLAYPLCNGGARGFLIIFQYLLDDDNRFGL